MLRKWFLPVILLCSCSSVFARDRAVELSVGGGIYFPSNDDYNIYFDGQPASFSFQASFLGNSSVAFKLRGDYITKQINSGILYAAERLIYTICG